MAQLLTSELTSLGLEARRKHPEIKQATDSVLARLKSEPDALLASSRRDAGPPQDHPLLRPILLSCETKLPKVISLAMALLQRMLLQRLVPDKAVPTIVKTLNQLLTPPSRSDVDVQLKILQIASALLSSYPSLHNADLSNTLMLGFKLHEGSKVAVVSSTAAATLRQSVMAVFDKVKDEDAVLDGITGGGEEAAASAPLAAMSVDLPEGSVTLFPSSRDAYLVFSDLCSLANAESATFLALDSLSKTFSLELIESVLSNHQRLFASAAGAKASAISHPELLFLLRSKVCPLLIKSLSEPPAFPIHLRLMRLLFLLLRQFSSDLVLEVEILLSILLRTVNPSSQETAAHGGSQPLLWQQVLALEVLRSLCSDDVFLRNLWAWYDSSKAGTNANEATSGSVPVFSKLVETLQSVLLQGEHLFAYEASMQGVPGSPRRSRVRQSAERSFSGLYEAAAGVASAAMSGIKGSTESSGTESLSAASSPSVQIIDQLDKIEAPSVASAALPKTYAQLLALQSCHLLTQSMALYALPLYSKFVNSRGKDAAPAPPAMTAADMDALSDSQEQEGLNLTKSMLRSSALPLSDVLSRYLRLKCTDAIFEETLLALRNLTNVTGALDLVDERDAILTIFIALAVPGWDAAAPAAVLQAEDGVSIRHLACLRAYVQVAYYLSGALGPFWYPVLSGLCSAEALLASANAPARAGKDLGRDPNTDENTAGRNGRVTLSTLTHGSMSSLDTRSGRNQLQLLNVADLQPARLQAHIKSVFENTASLADSAFLYFVSSLCRISADMLTTAPSILRSAEADGGPTSPQASGFRRGSRAEGPTSFYPITCLDLVATLNTRRLCSLPSDQGWDAVTSHLNETLSNPELPPTWRWQASQAANKLAFGAMTEAAQASDEADKSRLQKQVMQILANAAVLEGKRATPVDMDIRTSSVDNLKRILETFGHSLVFGWDSIFEICSATCRADKRSPQTEQPSSASLQKGQLALVKAGFSCLQLVCSDFLAALDVEQIRKCCSNLNDFGSQEFDVNVALTANGCLWGVTAEMATRAKKTSTEATAATVDKDAQPLWLFLLQCLLSIAQSPRSEVRNGAISNLFRVLQQYGDMLNPEAWQEILDSIIFPLMKVLDASTSALESGVEDGTSQKDRQALMIGTLPSELKQWQESQSLALTQFGEAVRSFLPSKLIRSSAFEETWTRLLDLSSRAFLQGPADLSQAAIKCLASALSATVDDDKHVGEAERARVQAAWWKAWDSWVAVGEQIRRRDPQPPAEPKPDNNESADPFRFTQKNLLAYIQAFQPIHRILRAEFDEAKVAALFSCLKGCVSYPHSSDNTPDRSSLTNVQEAARATARSVAGVKAVPALMLSDLSECICLAYSGIDAGTNAGKKQPTFIALSRASIDEAFDFFVKHEDDASIYNAGAVESLISALVIPIKLKYECPDSQAGGLEAQRKANVRPIWQVAILTLCKILSRSCPKLHSRAQKEQLPSETVERLWTKVVDAVEAAVLADSSLAQSLPADVKNADELFGLHLLSTIERFILPCLGEKEVRDHLIGRVARALTLGSKLYTFEAQIDADDRSGRVDDPQETTNERFAYWCFDLLFLACSARFGGSHSQESADSDAQRRVATILLRHLIARCEQTLLSFARDLEIRGMIPMQRIRQEELNYILHRYLELQLSPSTYSPSSTQPDGEPAAVVAWHSSRRAHLFSAFQYLLLLVSARPSSVVASIGTSLPPIVPADTVGLSKSFKDLGLELGMIGTTSDVFGVGSRVEGMEKVAARDLAAQALTLVGADLGVPVLPA
ncbi:Mon2 [Kalmanozyma brasiliensis GHG001]|uniref:Mon2 n=1 Tax=Kalmanozyma brasiliensis (strain GHG001) TaxID=1365824 RepID=UPI0028682C25|nr:Mon2 [Kalmanozyma brasiliensis GHG001]EST06476.2 Mon2 [Kalmanozyma brasiliensis GHG001]